MNILPNKDWTESISSTKKYLSRQLTYRLALKLNPKEYEVVFETPLIKGGVGEPDIVVFDKCRGWTSLMAIEICKADEITDMFIIARELMEKYSLLDFFLFDQDSECWYNIKRNQLGYDVSSNSQFMGIALDKLKDPD
jgi:hypothetical protein